MALLGPSHFKPEHPFSVRATAAGLFFRMCQVSPLPKIEKCSSGDGAAAGGSEAVYMCVEDQSRSSSRPPVRSCKNKM